MAARCCRICRLGSHAYFNHSFYCQPGESSDILPRTDYGLDFASACPAARILFGVQFHPEKSQRVGQRILANFFNL
jgi:imidazole glycerol-phosphate synthase subunit HisH